MADALVQQDAPLKTKRGRQPNQVTKPEEIKEVKKELSPEEKFLAQKFDPNKKYMFELAAQNMERPLPVMNFTTKKPVPTQKFRPFHNIVFSSQIVWKNERRNIRYYDGCTTLFVDEQPKEKETIDQLIKQTKRRNFLHGKFGCYGDERMLILYMLMASWNSESDFRTRTANMVWKSSDRMKSISSESQKLDAQERSLQLAKEASEEKMLMHASYLGIPLVDYDSGNELTPKEIRIEYRKTALLEPDKFIESYGNKKIEMKYYIDKALEKGLIHNKLNANKAMWKNDTVICDISGLRSHEAIAEKLFEFSNLEEGEEFGVQLRSLFS